MEQRKIKQKYLSFLIVGGLLIAIVVNAVLTQPTIANSLSMNTKEQIAEMVVRQAKGWEQQNAEAIADDFAQDAIFIAAGFKFEGKQQIERAARDYFKQFERTKVEIKRVIISDEQGAVEWDWRDRHRQTGKEGYAEDAIIFELQDGKIVYWREYIEKKK